MGGALFTINLTGRFQRNHCIRNFPVKKRTGPTTWLHLERSGSNQQIPGPGIVDGGISCINDLLNDGVIKKEELPNLVGKKNYMLFRGKMNKESGLNSILDLYLSLPEDFFLVIATNKKIIKPLPERIIVLDRLLEDSEIKWLYENSIASFGQFGNSRRMSRSIPHKFFESVEFNIPYLTPIYAPIMRLLGPEYKFWATEQNHFDYKLFFKIEKFEYPLDLKKKLNSNYLQIQFNDALRSLSR